jgi:ribosomal-protein-alanine N-acetyltransferase
VTAKELPHSIETERLVLRRPQIGDAEAVFLNYANDVEVTKYMSWPRHESIEVTEQVVEFWINQWNKSSSGAFLITDRTTGRILGSTGFDRLNAFVVSTGYILAREEWGKGYATEALEGIVSLAQDDDVQRLFAYCHHEHDKSAHVMEKCGFKYEGRLRNYMEFPNLSPGEATDVLLYAWIPEED